MNIDGVEISVDNLGQDLLELLVGERWPNGDAGAMRSLASAWNDAASQLDEIRQTASAAAKQVAQYCQGENGDSFQSFWSGNFDDGRTSWPSGVAPAALPFAVQFCRSMAAALNAGADQIETTKDTIMGNIAILVATVAPQIAAGFFDFGATDATAAAEIVADRAAMQVLLDGAKELIAEVVEQAIEQGLQQAELNFAIQFKEVMEGHASGIAWGEVGESGLSGAAGGALGAGFGFGLGKAGAKVFGEDFGSSFGSRMATGVASGGLTSASMDLIENGKISASDFTKGSLAGVLGGMGGAEAAAAERPAIDTEHLPTDLTTPQNTPDLETGVPDVSGQTDLSGLGMPHPDTVGTGTGATASFDDGATVSADHSGFGADSGGGTDLSGGVTMDPSQASAAGSSIAGILGGGGGTQDAGVGVSASTATYDSTATSAAPVGLGGGSAGGRGGGGGTSIGVTDSVESGGHISGSGLRPDAGAGAGNGTGVTLNARGYASSTASAGPGSVDSASRSDSVVDSTVGAGAGVGGDGGTVGAGFDSGGNADTIPTSARPDAGAGDATTPAGIGPASDVGAGATATLSGSGAGAGAGSDADAAVVGDTASTSPTSPYSAANSEGGVGGGFPLGGGGMMGDAGIGSSGAFATGGGGGGRIGGLSDRLAADSGLGDVPTVQSARIDDPGDTAGGDGIVADASSGRFYGGGRDRGLGSDLDATTARTARSAGDRSATPDAAATEPVPVRPSDSGGSSDPSSRVERDDTPGGDTAPRSQDPVVRDAASPGPPADDSATAAPHEADPTGSTEPAAAADSEPTEPAGVPAGALDDDSGLVAPRPENTASDDATPAAAPSDGSSAAGSPRPDGSSDDLVWDGSQPEDTAQQGRSQPSPSQPAADPTASRAAGTASGTASGGSQPSEARSSAAAPSRADAGSSSQPDGASSKPDAAKPNTAPSGPDAAGPSSPGRPVDAGPSSDAGRAQDGTTRTDAFGNPLRPDPTAANHDTAILYHLDPGVRTPDDRSGDRGSWSPRQGLSGELAEVGERAEATDHGIANFSDPEMAELARKVPPDPDGAFTGDIHGDATGVLSGLTRMTPEEYLRVLDANGHEPGQPIRLLSCEAGAMDDGFAAQLARVSGCKVIAANTEVWSDEAGHLFASRTHTDGFGEPAPDIPPNGTWHEFSPDGTKTEIGTDGFPPGHEEGFGNWGAPVGDTRSRGGSEHHDEHHDEPSADSAERREEDPDRPRPAETTHDPDRQQASAGAPQHPEPTQHTAQEHHHTDDDGRAPPPEGRTGHGPTVDHGLTVEPAAGAEARQDQADEQDTNEATQTFLLLCTEYSAKKGGVVVFNRALAEALADAGQNVVVRIGEDAAPYADLQRPDLRILGPKDLPPATVGPDGEKVEPNPGDYLGTAHDPDGMPERADYVMGQTRFSGPDAKATRDARYPNAKLIHFTHMVPEALGRVKENGDPPSPGKAAEGIQDHEIERGLVAGADLAVGVGPSIAEDVRRMVAQAKDSSARTGEPVMTQAVHELIPGMEFRDRPERSTEGRPLNVLLFGRTDVGQKGGRAAAAVIGRLKDEGLPVRLVVRGVPERFVEQQRRELTQIVGDEVEVRPFTLERSDLYEDFDDADVMIMTSRAEGFGLTAQEAAAAGVPIVVPSGSGFGRWLGESDQFSEELTEPSIVEQGFEDQVSVDPWVGALRNVATDYPAAQQRALDLQQQFKDQKVTWDSAVGSLIDEARRLQ